MIPTQERILDSLNHYVDDLIIHIRKIQEENSHDDEMAANKMKKLITHWFKNGGHIN